MNTSFDPRRPPGAPEEAWDFLRALADSDTPDQIRAEAPWLQYRCDGSWGYAPDVADEAADFMDLYLPLCLGGRHRSRVCAQLGQSIDGQIATAGGDAFYVTGEANRIHLHRLRALSDAVVVGAHTVTCDDPQLTTRKASGDHPVRVVLDPHARLDPRRFRLCNDGAAATLLVHAADASPAHEPPSQCETLFVPRSGQGLLDLKALLAQLAARGLRRVFVEGGGITVTRFLEQGLLDRLHLAVAPLLIGDGQPGLRLPAVMAMRECPRPACHVFRLGCDLMWDFDLRASRTNTAAASPAVARVY